jgi:hypothetical protein
VVGWFGWLAVNQQRHLFSCFLVESLRSLSPLQGEIDSSTIKRNRLVTAEHRKLVANRSGGTAQHQIVVIAMDISGSYQWLVNA